MAGIMDSIRNLFGGSAASNPPQGANEPDSYKDCLIYAEPMAEGGQWRLAGRTVKPHSSAVATQPTARRKLSLLKPCIILNLTRFS